MYIPSLREETFVIPQKCPYNFPTGFLENPSVLVSQTLTNESSEPLTKTEDKFLCTNPIELISF